MNSDNDNDIENLRLLTLKQVAELLNKSSDTVKAYVRLRIFPSPIQIRPGGQGHWTLGTVKRWLEKRRRARYQAPSPRGSLKQGTHQAQRREGGDHD